MVTHSPYSINCAVYSATCHKDRKNHHSLSLKKLFADTISLMLPMADHVTRPSNANAHPGMVDRNPPHHSRDEVQAEKCAKAAEKASVEQEKKANIKKVAALECAEKQKAADMARNANNPINPIVPARIRQTRMRPDNIDDSNGKYTFAHLFCTYISIVLYEGPAKKLAKRNLADTPAKRNGQICFLLSKLTLTDAYKRCR
jgi:hypothetical protein